MPTVRDRLRGSALAVVAFAALACGPREPRIEIRDAWARPTIAPGAQTVGTPVPESPGVVYASIVNHGRAPDRLLGARSDVCASVEIHRTVLEGDRMVMAPVTEGIEVPARGRIELQPGDYHAMLFGLERHLRTGERFEIELEFERSGPVPATVEVRGP